jgi:hypothetical protein
MSRAKLNFCCCRAVVAPRYGGIAASEVEVQRAQLFEAIVGGDELVQLGQWASHHQRLNSLNSRNSLVLDAILKQFKA